MCTNTNAFKEDEEYLQLKKRSEKRNQNRFSHLFKEKVYYISKRNSQSITTGYRPDQNGVFRFCIRFDDSRYNDFLCLTLFQYVSLMKDLRKFDDEENRALDEIDGSIKFSFKDINVPKVIIQVDASYSSPKLFELTLCDNLNKESYSMVMERKTVLRIIEYENELINTVDLLEDASSSILFNSFVLKCVDYVESLDTKPTDKSIYFHVKSMQKTAFQSEIFLKFWPLIYNHIKERCERGISDSDCGTPID